MSNSMYKSSLLATTILTVLGFQQAAQAHPSQGIQEFTTFKKPLVIGHRGTAGYRPEHTLESYALAIKLGADFIEPDLVLTKDGQMVARHEPMIGSTTNVASFPEFADRKTKRIVDGVEYNDWFVSDFTLQELKKLRAVQPMANRDQQYNGQFQIPALYEIIALAKQSSVDYKRTIGIYPEIKHSTYHSELKDQNNKALFGRYFFEKSLLKTLHRAYGNQASAPVFIQSFEVSNLRYLNQHTDIKLVQLLDADDVKDDGSIVLAAPYRQPYDFVAAFNPHTFADLLTDDGLDFIKTYADAIGPWKPYLVKTVADGVDRNGDGKITVNDRRVDGSTGVLEMAHEKGLDVHTWTFRNDAGGYGFSDPKAEMAYYFDLGVDGLFTDFTDTGIAAREMSASYHASLPNGISSGDTTQTSTVLWARAATAGNVNFKVQDAGKVIFEQSVAVSDPLIPAKLAVKHLSASKQYTYSVTSPDNKTLNGSFKTAAAGDNTEAGLSFGVTGDWRGELTPFPAVKNVNGKALDFFVKLGDTIYADYPSAAVGAQALSLADYRNKQAEVYASHNDINSLADLQRNVSIFSIIDDHEVIDDFAGGASASSDSRFNTSSGLINQTPLYNNGLQAFTEYNAIDNQRYDAKTDSLFHDRPDLYRAQRFGLTAALYILDARSFRDEPLKDITDITSPTEIGSFVAKAFDVTQPAATRSLLGKRQLDRLKADLLAAQADEVLWKFVVVPEPIQNLGVFLAADRFEGYASERSELLAFINDNAIKNVVFISSDIHGTVINDLTYQRRADVLTALNASGNPLAAPQIKTSAFEITTGSVAFSPAFGDAVAGLLSATPSGKALIAKMFEAVGVKELAAFNLLPMATKNTAMQGLLDVSLKGMGYSAIGLQDNERIAATLLKGGNTALFSFGWSKFDIAPKTHELKITTYGITPYSAEEMTQNKVDIMNRAPEVMNQLLVKPQL